MMWIGDIVEGNSGLNGLTLWWLDRICTARVLGANKDFPSIVHTKVIASCAWVTWDEAEGVHVPWVSDVGDDDPEQSRRVAAQVGNAFMNPRSLKTSAQPRCLGIRREPRTPEVAMTQHFEVLAAGKVSGLRKGEVEDISPRTDLRFFNLD